MRVVPPVGPAWRLALLLLVWGVGAGAPPALADASKVRGSIAFGYSKLIAPEFDTPPGSLSTSAGLSYPVRSDLAVGPTITFHLLGSRTVERGSLLASVDYSAFEAGLFAHWRPARWGPIGLISAGPELFSARAELSTTGGGAGFGDLALQKVVGGAGLDVTVMKTRESPVRVGLELGVHRAFLHGADWTLASARLAFHY